MLVEKHFMLTGNCFMYVLNNQTTLILNVPKDLKELKDPKDPKDPNTYFNLANLAFFNQSSKYCNILVMLK